MHIKDKPGYTYDLDSTTHKQLLYPEVWKPMDAGYQSDKNVRLHSQTVAFSLLYTSSKKRTSEGRRI